jgi:outer membrane biosynthesis protein TonB
MTDPDRGAYTPPTDAPLSFDARRPVRGGPPVPMTLVISAIVLVALVVAVFFFYRSGVRGADDAPQPVGDPIGAITAPAPAEAQPADPAAGLQIYQQDALPAEPTFTPGPEQPAPRPTTPVQAESLPPVAAAPKAAPAAPAPKAAPVPAPKAATPAPKATATGSFLVQIGALSSNALADKAWNEAVALAPGAAAGKGKSVQEVDSNGKTLFRTAVTGFGTRAEATAFCDQLKVAGKSCFVR